MSGAVKRCAQCERRLRAGSTKWALMAANGGFVRQLVCRTCFADVLPVLFPKPATVAPLCVSCKNGLASVCAHCAGALADHVRELLAANLALRQGAKS